MSRYRIGVDIGGTFTDFVMLDAKTGRLHNDKVLTTPDDPSEAIIAGVVHALRQQVDLVAVGSIGWPAPLDVRVVGMPERITTTEVLRDPRSNTIIGSRQVEADSAPAC